MNFDFLTTLRAEAERVSEANYMMLMHRKERGTFDLAEEVGGKTRQDRTLIGGMTVAIGSYVGIMGIASANIAAAAGSAGLLASASTALASLGTIAVGSAVLPAATVVAIGGGLAGAAVALASRVMPVNLSAGIEASNAALAGDVHTLSKLARENVGLGDWFTGAKNLAMRTLRQTFLGENERAVSEHPLVFKAEAAMEYDLEELFGESPEASRKGMNAIAEAVSTEIWERHKVVVPETKVHECLGRSRGNEVNTGKILAVDFNRGIAVQSIGRGQAVIHNLRDLQKIPEVGQDITLTYRNGKLQPVPEQNLERGRATALAR